MPLLLMEGITKVYPGVVANAGITLGVDAGEIHALLGENGAGKSTLMHVLYGLTQPDSGKILWRGEPVRIAHANDAIQLGIGMVHQHFHLVGCFTAVENILLQTRPSLLRPRLDLKSARARLSGLCEEYGLRVDLDRPIEEMSLGGRQRVEILKAVDGGARLLILDEPTAVLSPPEVADLFDFLRRFIEGGGAALLITHKLREVREISHRVSVLRAGRLVFNGLTGATTEQELVRHLVGRDVSLAESPGQARTPPQENAPTRLRVADLSVATAGREALHDISLEVRRGEILGIAGVEGNGQETLFDALGGLQRVSAGHVEMLGEDTTHATPARLRRLSLGRIPEDRHATGLLLDLNIEANLILNLYNRAPYSSAGWRRDGPIRTLTRDLFLRFDIRAPGLQTIVRSLSGGNQQKIILARELHRNPALLIVANPVRGLDIGATEYVYGQLRKQREAGAAILLISSDLEEILNLSDRVAVLYRGKLMGTLDAAQASRDRVGSMMAGFAPAAAN
jgi:simple sugar transport system ATP-binding protein